MSARHRSGKRLPKLLSAHECALAHRRPWKALATSLPHRQPDGGAFRRVRRPNRRSVNMVWASSLQTPARIIRFIWCSRCAAAIFMLSFSWPGPLPCMRQGRPQSFDKLKTRGVARPLYMVWWGDPSRIQTIHLFWAMRPSTHTAQHPACSPQTHKAQGGLYVPTSHAHPQRDRAAPGCVQVLQQAAAGQGRDGVPDQATHPWRSRGAPACARRCCSSRLAS